MVDNTELVEDDLPDEFDYSVLKMNENENKIIQ